MPQRIRPALLLIAAGLVLATGGCGGGSPSTLDPHGSSSSRVAGLWWLLFWISLAVFTLVVVLIAVAVARRRGADVVARRGGGAWMVVAGGVALPAVVLTAVWVVGLRTMSALGDTGHQDLTVRVIGHEWWWEVHYPGGVATANEIHVPVGQRVRFELSSADVIHSFWVPQLGPKTDLIPGMTNVTWFQARRAGTFRGQCAEYCGLQHANMAVLVTAEAPAAFDRWLSGQRQAVATPSDAVAARGLDTVVRNSCAACHTLRGTTAAGKVGPDLTHLGSRQTLGAGVLANNPGNLGGWIIDSQSIKPGNHMPPQQLTPEQLQAVIRYFETQR
ncbi:MAG TPA: cytochrome c oxidase subunit II [Actinomycetota bacterium]|jgi:cytochrome c oxidase subunit 2|nr:cytochrome c oxidase subunit II [Actinomycetota bacterium]